MAREQREQRAGNQYGGYEQGQNQARRGNQRNVRNNNNNANNGVVAILRPQPNVVPEVMDHIILAAAARPPVVYRGEEMNGGFVINPVRALTDPFVNASKSARNAAGERDAMLANVEMERERLGTAERITLQTLRDGHAQTMKAAELTDKQADRDHQSYISDCNIDYKLKELEFKKEQLEFEKNKVVEEEKLKADLAARNAKIASELRKEEMLLEARLQREHEQFVHSVSKGQAPKSAPAEERKRHGGSAFFEKKQQEQDDEDRHTEDNGFRN